MAKQDKIWDRRDYGRSKARNVLARTFRELLLENGVMPNVYSKLIAYYIANIGSELSREEKSNLRGNLPKSLEKDKMSIDTFFRGLRVLQYDGVEAFLVLYKGDKRILKRFTVDLGSVIENPLALNCGSEYLDPNIDVEKLLRAIMGGDITVSDELIKSKEPDTPDSSTE